MRKPAFCICKNKGTDQLFGSPLADQCFCFHYIDITIPLLPKCLKAIFCGCTAGFCLTWLEIPNTGFLMTRSIKYQLLKISSIEFVSIYLHFHSVFARCAKMLYSSLQVSAPFGRLCALIAAS